MNIKIADIKELMRQSMIEEFESDGYLNPILFFYKDGNPMVCSIPDKYLTSAEGKHELTEFIRNFCNQPNVFAAGLIMEDDGIKLDQDNELTKLLMNGDVRVSELKDKQDFIIMIFSTPESEDVTLYLVDIENKKVCEQIDSSGGQVKGIFSNFFYWDKN